MNTVVFLVETSEIVAILFVNYKGRPWMKVSLIAHAVVRIALHHALGPRHLSVQTLQSIGHEHLSSVLELRQRIWLMPPVAAAIHPANAPLFSDRRLFCVRAGRPREPPALPFGLCMCCWC
jgi:hypothetical protein